MVIVREGGVYVYHADGVRKHDGLLAYNLALSYGRATEDITLADVG